MSDDVSFESLEEELKEVSMSSTSEGDFPSPVKSRATEHTREPKVAPVNDDIKVNLKEKRKVTVAFGSDHDSISEPVKRIKTD